MTRSTRPVQRVDFGVKDILLGEVSRPRRRSKGLYEKKERESLHLNYNRGTTLMGIL